MISWVIKCNGVPIQEGKSNTIPCSLQFPNTNVCTTAVTASVSSDSPVYAHMKDYDIQYLDFFQKQQLHAQNVSKVVDMMEAVNKIFRTYQSTNISFNLFLIKVIDAWVYLSNIGSSPQSNFHTQFTDLILQFYNNTTSYTHIYKLVMNETITPTTNQIDQLHSIISYFINQGFLTLPFQPVNDVCYVGIKLACRYMMKLNSQATFQRSSTPPRQQIENPIIAPNTPPQLKRIIRK